MSVAEAIAEYRRTLPLTLSCYSDKQLEARMTMRDDGIPILSLDGILPNPRWTKGGAA